MADHRHSPRRDPGQGDAPACRRRGRALGAGRAREPRLLRHRREAAAHERQGGRAHAGGRPRLRRRRRASSPSPSPRARWWAATSSTAMRSRPTSSAPSTSPRSSWGRGPMRCRSSWAIRCAWCAPEIGADRGRAGSVSLMSRASLRQLAEVAGSEPVDGRRFRMLIEVEGVDAHAEDELGPPQGARRPALWCSGTATSDGAPPPRAIPTAARSPSPPCTCSPPTARSTPARSRCPFGIYGEVLEGGRVQVGDEVEVVR